MLKILLIQEDLTLNEKITFVLESVNGVIVTPAKDFQEAKEIASEKDRINLILVNLPSGRSAAVKEFQKAVRSIDCILVVNDLKDHEETIGWKILEKIPRNSFGAKIKELMEKIINDRYGYFEKFKFCRIKTSILLETIPLHCDIYAKLSETKYLKVFLEGDVFDANDFIRYTEKKKIEYLYLKEDSLKGFIEKYVATIDQVYSRQISFSYDELAKMNHTAFETIQDMIKVVGFTNEIQTLTKKHLQLMLQKMNKRPNLMKLLSKVIVSKGKYSSEHSYLLNYIAFGIANHMNWGSEATFYKLSLAAFFHDITLMGDDLTSCSTIEEARKLGIDESSLEGFKNHPEQAADLVRRMSEVPSGVDTIILQHHEMPDGSGFPLKTTANYISPLSTVFIIAHDMAKEVIRSKEQGKHFDLLSYLTNAQYKFPYSNFKKILDAAKKIDIPG
jgi:HD-GYP domain-containing protein (c-di-GMP phosphodiesterase class II)